MHWLDYLIFAVYLLLVMAVGLYFFYRNRQNEDYYVGGRNMGPLHIGLSVVATDVGGGFSIGLGGVGFVMGLSGSWLLFTGLVGAWLSAIFIIPKIKQLDRRHGMMTFPDFLRYRYDERVALMAALISGIGYLGFTAAQILAGAKLASATIFATPPLAMDPLLFSLIAIAIITVTYTVFGGLKAVIYTDTVQWIILIVGLTLVTIPFALAEVGGLTALRQQLPDEFFRLDNITASEFINWMITIIPIWLIGMTLYQRIYATRNAREAQRAWYLAGLFEYPVMAFTGVFLGMIARLLFPASEAEMAMPRLISEVLPIGLTGIVIAAYFSAIMSTADSCMMASSGNFVNDLLLPLLGPKQGDARRLLRLSMLATFIIGSLAIIIAAFFTTVLEAILYAYAFMVAGLFIPTLGAYFWPRATARAALAAMLGGGTTTLVLLILAELEQTPIFVQRIGLDVTAYGMAVSALLFIGFSLLSRHQSARRSYFG
jgi:SSS family solute:Na+ symporter